MNTSLAKFLVFWIPSQKVRRRSRAYLINLQPLRRLLQRKSVSRYLNEKQKRGKSKIVIYSAVSGGYDKVRDHAFLSKDFDYVLFTDSELTGEYSWDVRAMTEYEHDLPVRKAKYYKLFPDQLFPEYEYSVWVDGKIEFTDDGLEKRIKHLISKDTAIACLPHRGRECLYGEAAACIENQVDSEAVIRQQIDFYRNDGFPEENGLYELSVIFRQHHHPGVKRLMNCWWKGIQRYSFRDQLSFPYCVWKNKIKVELIFERGKFLSIKNWGHIKGRLT